MSNPEQPAEFRYDFSNYNKETFEAAIKTLPVEQLTSFTIDYAVNLGKLSMETQNEIDKSINAAILSLTEGNYDDVDEAFPELETKPEL